MKTPKGMPPPEWGRGRVCRHTFRLPTSQAFQHPELVDLDAVMRWDDPAWITAHVLSPSRVPA